MTPVWCLDPGQITGVALFHVDDGRLILKSWSECLLWEGLDQLICFNDIVVYENIIARHPSFNPIGLEVIGVIKYLSVLKSCQLVRQSPGMIGGIQKWPIYQWKHIKSQHERDAIAHGIVFAGSQKLRVELPESFLTHPS